ncbi:MAG: FAD-dependent 5-carboxymethylaminomethyl-2-thiouridine(34) oxidoreductase MnmC, partial [Phenylobacterium sp.]
MQSGPSPIEWTEDGRPCSALYGDAYFGADDGLAESRAVFLAGCGLPGAWSGRRRFTVGELGFGTGLNILALLDLWRREGPAGGRLHIFSVEAHLMSREDAERALAAWPELAPLAEVLLSRWPETRRGFHRIDLPEFGAVVDLALMDVADALGVWDGRADAWFLDGFAPALNPGMWREEVLQAVAARSAPGARAATFTVAGRVRRGLEAAGFAVRRAPGHGRKRERLEAVLPGTGRDPEAPGAVAVVGAGIAGAAVRRALLDLGVAPVLFEAETPGAGASGNPAGLVTPRLDAGLGPVARLAAQAYLRALDIYGGLPGAIISRGVLQLAASDRDAGRFARIAASDLFPPGALQVLDPDAASARLGEPVERTGLDQPGALSLDPREVLRAWCGGASTGRVCAITPDEGGWRLSTAEGGTQAFRAVILAAGASVSGLWAEAPVLPVRGQASWTETAEALRPRAAGWGGYIAPTAGGFLFGATFRRGETSTEVTDEDHRANLEALSRVRPGLAGQLAGRSIRGRASIRATTRDHLPMAGVVPGCPGLHVLGGLGSRGLTWAPLLAEHVAAGVAGLASPLPQD